MAPENDVRQLRKAITRLETIADQLAERQHNFESRMEAEILAITGGIEADLLAVKCSVEKELLLIRSDIEALKKTRRRQAPPGSAGALLGDD